MSETTTSLSTPNPVERSLLVLVEESVFANSPDIVPAPRTLYKDFPDSLIPQEYPRDRWGEYVYTYPQGTHGLLFAKNKTLTEANTPFRKTTWKGNHRWPPILLGVAIIPDYGSPRSFPVMVGNVIGTGVGPTYYDQVHYIPDVSEGTRFVKEEFFGPTQFNIPQTPVPVPTSVSYLLPGGITGNFPECLHDTIKIDATITNSQQLVSGSVSRVGTTIGQQIFPATNFTDWSPYILSDTQERQDGGWYRVRIRVFPPPQPESILAFN